MHTKTKPNAMKQFAVLGFAAVMAVALTGCAAVVAVALKSSPTTRVVDTTQNETKKGYVEFSLQRSDMQLQSWAKIWKVENAKMKLIGRIHSIPLRGLRGNIFSLKLRVAAAPGVHKFALDRAQVGLPKVIEREFDVTILENMVTPVQISLIMDDWQRHGNLITIYYHSTVNALEALPVE